MSILDRALDPPSYGWSTRPTARQQFAEFFSRLNLFRDRRNWVAATNWFWTLALQAFLIAGLVKFITIPLFLLAVAYGLVFMGTCGTIWFHRYSTHRAYVFSSRLARFLTRNLAIKVIVDETYVISHHVHHAKSDQEGDPYRAEYGFLYCYLADVTTQGLARDLSESEYATVSRMLDHTGIRLNSYAEYQKWGSIAHPLRTQLHYILNWSFWYGTLFLLGGHGLAVAIFSGAAAWALGIRTFNFAGHGGGKMLQQEGWDFYRRDLSINQYLPGLVAGEWHNNHHLYPNGARAGFLPTQIDLAWYYIWLLHALGGVQSYRDYKPQFMAKYVEPYRQQQQMLSDGE